MFSQPQPSSIVTVALPPRVMHDIAEEVANDKHTFALLWRARGSLIHEHWTKKWLPPISPGKSILQVVLPKDRANRFVNRVIQSARLDQQAFGAVFSITSDDVFFGADFDRSAWTESGSVQAASNTLEDNLHAIYCVVSPKRSDKICKAAIDAGAHGPIVYLGEGRGLRDRLGWLRITKSHDKEVLMVLCDSDHLTSVFDAMAAAGELHLPGRGFMYECEVEHGMFNLPSRTAPQHHDASLQQIVTAIDKLQGHTHWRDQSVFQIGSQGQAVGVAREDAVAADTSHFRVLAIVADEQLDGLMDLMLDNGATGLNLSSGRLVTNEPALPGADTHVAHRFSSVSAVTDEHTAQRLASIIESQAKENGVSNLCVCITNVPRIATYTPGRIDYRRTA